MKTNKKRFNKKLGFTVIEMVVSLGLFSSVLSISVGALLSMINSNRKTQSLRSAMDNLNLATEEMSRSIIQGRTYHCGESGEIWKASSSCNSEGDTFFAFEAHDGSSTISDQIVYKLDATNGRLQKSINSGTDFKDVTAPSIKIDNLKFYVYGSDPLNKEVPRVVITIGGTAGTKESTRSSFNIQTTASQRALK